MLHPLRILGRWNASLVEGACERVGLSRELTPEIGFENVHQVLAVLASEHAEGAAATGAWIAPRVGLR